MGGRFRALMPSNLLHPGACAVESLPAPGNEYASHMAKGELRRLFKRCVAGVCQGTEWTGYSVRLSAQHACFGGLMQRRHVVGGRCPPASSLHVWREQHLPARLGPHLRGQAAV